MSPGRLVAAVDQEGVSKVHTWREAREEIGRGSQDDEPNSLQRRSRLVAPPAHGAYNQRYGERQAASYRLCQIRLRPATTDLCRLAPQQWREVLFLETTFLDGYGADPESETVWPPELLPEAISTAAWSSRLGDEEFESEGHRMLHEAHSQLRFGWPADRPARARHRGRPSSHRPNACGPAGRLHVPTRWVALADVHPGSGVKASHRRGAAEGSRESSLLG